MADFFCVQVQHNRSKPVTQLLGQLEVGSTETQDFLNMIPRSHVQEQDFVYVLHLARSDLYRRRCCLRPLGPFNIVQAVLLQWLSGHTERLSQQNAGAGRLPGSQ